MGVRGGTALVIWFWEETRLNKTEASVKENGKAKKNERKRKKAERQQRRQRSERVVVHGSAW